MTNPPVVIFTVMIWIVMMALAFASYEQPGLVEPFPGAYVYRDAGTGCEYIKTERALTPRLNADGKPICRKEAAP